MVSDWGNKWHICIVHHLCAFEREKRKKPNQISRCYIIKSGCYDKISIKIKLHIVFCDEHRWASKFPFFSQDLVFLNWLITILFLSPIELYWMCSNSHKWVVFSLRIAKYVNYVVGWKWICSAWIRLCLYFFNTIVFYWIRLYLFPILWPKILFFAPSRIVKFIYVRERILFEPQISNLYYCLNIPTHFVVVNRFASFTIYAYHWYCETGFHTFRGNLDMFIGAM